MLLNILECTATSPHSNNNRSSPIQNCNKIENSALSVGVLYSLCSVLSMGDNNHTYGFHFYSYEAITQIFIFE